MNPVARPSPGPVRIGTTAAAREQAGPPAARYKHKGPKGDYWGHRRVVGFDDDWHPLVVTDDHRLDRADRYANFDGLDETVDPDGASYSAIMPAGGWRAEFTNKDGSVFDDPLVGWALKNDGAVVALTTDPEGLVDDLDGYAGKYRIYHPSQKETPVGDPDSRQQEP